MVTDKDQLALNFLEQFRMATPKQIAKIAYDDNIKICYNRLKVLSKSGLIYKTNNVIGKGHIYSANRIRTVKQFRHDNIRNEFYLKLLDLAEVYEVEVEKITGSIRPDILIICVYQGEPYCFSVEVETNANHSSVNYAKYNNFFLSEWQKYFNNKPVVVYVTDKNIDSSKIRFDYRHIKTDLSNFTDIFK